jgi:hypothetical protein
MAMTFREAARIAPGETIDVSVELDDQPRTVDLPTTWPQHAWRLSGGERSARIRRFPSRRTMMSTFLHRPKLAYPAFGALAALAGLLLVAHSATAQSATGTVSGRVLWGSCIRAIPLPMTPDGQAQPGVVQPGAPVSPDAQGIPDQRPVPAPINGLPAGAVLVAVQNTNVSARTDEAGRFTLSGVPAGQYMTVAAGPVAESVSATAERPNVFVSGGQSVDIGTLSLGGGGPVNFGIACRAVQLGVGAAGTVEATPGDVPAPTSP